MGKSSGKRSKLTISGGATDSNGPFPSASLTGARATSAGRTGCLSPGLLRQDKLAWARSC